MKKIGYGFISLLLLFMSMTEVRASSIDYHNGLSCNPQVTESDGRVSQTCTVNFTVTGGTATYNEMTATLTLNNVTLGSITPSNGWYLTNSDANHFYLETTMSELPVGHYNIATIKVYKIDAAKDCSVNYSFSFINLDRACHIYQSTYYDKNNHITTELEYEKECVSHTCEKLSDGTTYGKNGTVVDASTYEDECFPHICTVSNGKYYDKDGNATTELDYQKKCLTHTCEKLSDNTYYDKDGNVVDEASYRTSCDIKPNACSQKDGKFYDKNGNAVDETSYKISCETHTCEHLGDYFFDKTGNMVNEALYKESCQSNVVPTKPTTPKNNDIENPQTGANISYLFITIGLLTSIITLFFLKKNNKIYHI